MSIRLMIADDHLAIRAGVTSLLEGTDVQVVCQAESCEQTIRLAMTCDLDVVLLDVRLADEDGLDALREIKRERPSMPVLIFTASENLKDMAQAHRLGADGYILKGMARDEMLQTIRRATAGKRAWSVPQIRRITCRASTKAANTGDRFPLTDREKQVLVQIVGGAESNEAIGEALGIDVETVKLHVKHILRRLHLVDRTQAALWGLRNHVGTAAAQ